MASEYSIQELHRVVTQVTDFLSTTAVIGIVEFQQLLVVVGSGMATKLRLTPDADLALRLSHLYAVCKCASMVEPMFEDQVLVSVEGLNPLFPFDCDLILEKGNITYLIDFTATSDHKILSDKQRILQSKVKDPSISSRNVHPIVHRFQPEHFRIQIEWLCREPSYVNPETYTLAMLELMASKSYTTNEKFIQNCYKVKDHAAMRIRDIEHKHSNYSTTRVSADKVKLASISAGSNVVSDTCNIFLNINKKQYAPFIESLRELTAQHHRCKPPFIHRQADIYPQKKTLEELLLKLSDDLLAKVLHHSMIFKGKIAGVDANGDVHALASFPTSPGNKKMINPTSGYQICAKHIRGHYFKILFSFDSMDDQLRRTLSKSHKPSYTVPNGTKASIEECIEVIKNSERRHHDVTKIVNRRLPFKPHSTIFSKIITLCNRSKSDSGNVGSLATNLLSSMANSLDHLVCGSLLSHYYEITKSFSFSIKNSHKDETYYVGMNGYYDSVTITKMSATQDSFDRLHYSVISRFTGDKDYERICWSKHHSSRNTSRSHFRTMDNNEVSYNLRLPYYVLSLLTWDIETSLDKGRFSSSELPEKIANSTIHSLVNRDTFSQAAQQVRYLYMSSIGYGADASKIIDKITFFKPKFDWEYIYITRMIKLGLSLSLLRDNDSLDQISEGGNLKVVFPHTTRIAQTFSEVVSSMYYCNIFNKFRAFHEVSEAMCYTELDDEHKVYLAAKASKPSYLSGISRGTMSNITSSDYLISDDFVKAECDHVDELLASGSGRFRASCAVVIACSNKYLPHNESHIKQIYKELGRSPIDACTLRGSMSSGKPTDKNQGCRAASSILEELFRQYDMNAESMNNNAWLHSVFMTKIEESGGDASIYTLVCNQLADDTVDYIYRIVQKDQIGNREISVLNAVFRLGAMFIETISKCLSDLIKNIDLLSNPDKDYVFESAVKNAERESEKKDMTVCYDNSDQKRWGPNHMLNIFCAMFYGTLYKERGLLRIIYFVADKVLQKQAKFPESLIHLFSKWNGNSNSKIRVNRTGIVGEHGSETLKTFFKEHADDLCSNKFSTIFPYGMCQGIFHDTSSTYHGVMCRFQEDIFASIFGKSVSVKSFCTSDDASRIILMTQGTHRVAAVKKIHAVIINTGVLFNIIRNDAKSAFNFYIAEFNSIFFKKGIMATPSIKQRISKIDVGSGQNHVEDYLTVLSASANYFTVGGSYVGACILTLLNLALHTEQWSRWDTLLNNRFYYPVELGGFPVVEPISTCLSGAMSNVYLRCSDIVSSEQYAEIFSSVVSEKPDEFKLSDYFRVPKSISEDSNLIKIFKNSGALGLHSLVRTDKKLSQFESRHKMSQWNFPDHFLSLRKGSSDARYFLYNIYKNGCMSLFQESLGVNSFYKRFTDPWVSSDRKCVRVSKNSILTILGLESDINHSYDDVNAAMAKIKPDEIYGALLSMTKVSGTNQFTKNLITQLIPRLDDSKSILDFICSQECGEYLEPRDTPATSRVTLRNHEALDQEKYTADLIKVLSGEKARFLITELYGDLKKFDDLPSALECPNLDLKDSILIAENSIHAFNKYIKRNTKMITSGRPTTLSEIVTKVLRSRFFEGLGIRLTGTIRLIGDRTHAFSYTSWYRELNEKSKGYCNVVVNNSCRRLYSDVVKYGIISSNQVLTQKDQFEVADTPRDEKHMKIQAKSRSSLVTFCKSWVSANLSYSFTYDTIISFFRGNMLSSQGFRTGENTFVRQCSGLYFTITANGLPVLHLIETNVGGKRDAYRHIFLCETTNTDVELEIELTDIGKDKIWAVELIKSIPVNSNVVKSRSYKVPKSNDTFILESVDSSTSFHLDVPDYTATICLSSADFTIPVCHAEAKVVESVNLGYNLEHVDFINAVQIYSSILDVTSEFKVIPNAISTSLNFILYKTGSSSKIWFINKTLSKLDFGFTFNNTKEVDILKALLLSDNYASINVSSSKLYNYVNNLFKTPDYREGYIISVTDEDKLKLRLGDIMGSDDQAEDDIAIEDVIIEDDQDSDNASVDIDEDELQILVDDFDDISFEGFEDDEPEDPNDRDFRFLDLSIQESDPKEKIFQSSRTGITVNPNSEFPYAIMRYIQKWKSENKLLTIRGITSGNESVVNLPSAYLAAYRFGGSVPDNLFRRLTGVDNCDLPCSLSDLVTLERTVG